MIQVPLDSPDLPDILGAELFTQLQEDVEMLDGLIPAIDMQLISTGKIRM